MQGIDLTCNVLIEELANHRCLARVACKEDVDLAHITPLECRRHRLKEVLDTAPNAILKRTLELFHINVQTDLCAVARLPRLFRREERDLRIEAVPRRELLIARTTLPEGTQALSDERR